MMDNLKAGVYMKKKVEKKKPHTVEEISVLVCSM